MGNEITANCRKCGKPAPVNEFILDPNYRMMVCKNCAKNSRVGAAKQASATFATQQKQTAPEKQKPPGWDAEDEYLEKIAKTKTDNSVQVTKLPDGKLLYVCKKCKYKFKYNPEKGTPANCPNCGTPVGRIIPY